MRDYKFLYDRMESLEFRGASLSDLRAFPGKSMFMVGQHMQEIRIPDQADAFRVIHVARFGSAAQVPHCFQKKTRKTSMADLNLAARRHAELQRDLRQ